MGGAEGKASLDNSFETAGPLIPLVITEEGNGDVSYGWNYLLLKQIVVEH